MSFRRQQTDPIQDPFRSKAINLQDVYPSWSIEDLVSLLTEVNGDIQLAATRISEGHAEQWGSVTRKKDKKLSSSPTPDSRDRSFPRDSRGHRGRGGRGGGRGGARATSRHTNGHRATSSTAPVAELPINNGAITDPTNNHNSDSSIPALTAAASDPLVDPLTDGSTTTSAWGTSTPSSWPIDSHINGSASPSVPSQPVTPASVPSKLAKMPATSKLSWAQVARPQEKPAPVPTPAPLSSQPAPPQPPAEIPAQSEPTPPSPDSEFETPEIQSGWEEPTTIQPPSWDDEPQPKPPSTQSEAWPSSSPSGGSREELVQPAAPEHHEPVLSALPAQIQHQEMSRSSTPSTSGKRPSSAAHRNSSRFKTTDQAVVMPNSNFTPAMEKIGMQFGSLSLAGDDILDSVEIPEPTRNAVEPEVIPESKRSLQVNASSQELPTPESPAPASAVSPKIQTPSMPSTSSLFQQAIPQQAHQPAQPVQQSQQLSLPSSISQPSMPSQSSSSSISSPITPSFSQQSQSVSQPSLANHHQAQHLAQQSQTHTQYVQHGLPTHLDPAQNQVQHSPHAPQAQITNASGSHSSYFRPEAPYFHTPTPPTGQQDTSPYGNFGQIGQQMQHQSQGSHGGFGADYGYNDTRSQNFYDSYPGQGGFSNRSAPSHEELKGLVAAQQQNHANAGLPPSSAQSSQQPTQAGPGTPAGGQGPQQGYPHPVPYYYPFPQNQFYGSPYNSGYGVPQPFVKYPAMFQHGPPGPGSASPVTKQAQNPVQHSNPYAQSPYGQQHPSNAYDDIGYQHPSQHGHGQGVGTGLPGNDYSKQLYGGHGQGIQGFMGGLGQNTAGPNSGGIGIPQGITSSGAGVPQGIVQRTGGSPETAFKPYGPGKDMGVGVGQGVGQGGPQGRLGGVQQPAPGGGFYGAGAGRFGGNVGSGTGTGNGPQVQQSQQHQPGQGHQLGYPQGGSDGSSFYSYQRGQQYWQ